MIPHPLPAGCRPDTVTLRSAKSEESLSSQASGAGEHGVTLACTQVELGGTGALSWPPRGVLRFGGLEVFCFNLDLTYNKFDKASLLVHDALWSLAHAGSF